MKRHTFEALILLSLSEWALRKGKLGRAALLLLAAIERGR